MATTTEQGRAVTPAPPAWLAVLLVIERCWVWYRRNWRATAVSSVLQPLLFLLAFGVGFGSLVDAGGRGSAATGGLPYLVYLAPALLAVSAVQTAAFESSYPVYSGFKWAQIYWGMTATPVTPEQIALGQLGWISLRMLSSGAVYVLVIAAFGGVTGPGIVVSLLCAALCGTGFAALVMAFAATVQDESGPFSALFRFVVIPMTLFAGTFFPISQLPGWAQLVAWVTPLWHGTELARGAAVGSWELWPALGHLAYLLGLLVLGVGLVRWRFRVRLTR